MKFLVLAALVATAAAISVKMAPLLHSEDKDAIEGSYIVVFNPDVTEETVKSHMASLKVEMEKLNDPEHEKIVHEYKYALKGYSAKMNDRLRDQVRTKPEVKYVAQNGKVYINQGESCKSNKEESWGIGRVIVENWTKPDRCEPPGPGVEYDYLYEDGCDGSGVNIYVIDTGVDQANAGRYFKNSVQLGKDFIENRETGDAVDPNGHGTHCAGTSASLGYGLAHGAQIIAVRVLNSAGSGTFDDVVGGVDYVAGRHTSTAKSVINMSLGGGRYEPLNQAVERAFELGVHVVVAAGNENTDACSRSPASADVTTVGATDVCDARATFSNFGECTNIFAPGVGILAPYRNGDIASLSGTSMASPHVAGITARMITKNDESCTAFKPGQTTSPLDPSSIRNRLQENGLQGIITGLPVNEPNNILLHLPCVE